MADRFFHVTTALALPGGPAGRDRGAVRDPAGRGGRGLIRAWARRRWPPSWPSRSWVPAAYRPAQGLFREDPGDPQEVRRALRGRRGHLRLLPHRQHVGLRDLQHPPRSHDLRQAALLGLRAIAGLLMSQAFYDVIADESAKRGSLGMGYTYGGHPVAAAVAVETLKIYESDDILGHVRKVSAALPRPAEGAGRAIRWSARRAASASWAASRSSRARPRRSSIRPRTRWRRRSPSADRARLYPAPAAGRRDRHLPAPHHHRGRDRPAVRRAQGGAGRCERRCRQGGLGVERAGPAEGPPASSSAFCRPRRPWAMTIRSGCHQMAGRTGVRKPSPRQEPSFGIGRPSTSSRRALSRWAPDGPRSVMPA